MAKAARGITSSSTAEYFSKNLQQVGFSSQTKAILTTLKEAVDNSLDACEEEGILPELSVSVQKLGAGSIKNSDRIKITVVDNGPGIPPEDVPKVFGEYLASSKFGRGRCSRGQQGIGISAATTWAQLTNATGALVVTKTKKMRKAFRAKVEVDIKNNRGVLKNKENFDWDRAHGTSVEFVIDGRVHVNGEAGLLNYLMGNVLVNPHLTLRYRLPDEKKWHSVKRVSQVVPRIPSATQPHPHTMKLGEFIAHSHLYGKVAVSKWLKSGFSRVTDQTLTDLKKSTSVKETLLKKQLDSVSEDEFKGLFTGIQKLELRAPATSSVLTIGEDALAKSIQRVGETDFFAVVSRRPRICDFKPVQVEVAIARLKTEGGDSDEPVQVLRFANRVPLQFDKASCAIVQAINSVNWRSYGLGQPKRSLPLGPYIMAVSIVSPFIKFKNASKETIDSSDELVDEVRRALMQAGQKLSRHIKREKKANELEQRIRHIEQFGPMLVEGLVRITKSPAARGKKATQGLEKLLGRDAKETKQELDQASEKLQKLKGGSLGAGEGLVVSAEGDEEDTEPKKSSPKAKAKKSKAKKTKSKAKKKKKK